MLSEEKENKEREDGGGIYKEETGGGRGEGAVHTHALFPPALGPTTARETESKKGLRSRSSPSVYLEPKWLR